MESMVKEKRKPGRPRKSTIAKIIDSATLTDPTLKTTSLEGQGAIRETSAVSLHDPQEPTPLPAANPGDQPASTNISSPPPKSKGLTLKQRAFVRAYATPGSKTFGNATQSAIKANIGNNYNVSRSYASDLVAKPAIKCEIMKTYERHHLSMEDRSSVLSDLLHKEHNVTEQLDASGKVVSMVRTDNDKVRLAVVKELNRSDGTYARAESVARAQRDAVQPLIAHYAQQLRAALKEEDEILAKTALQASKEGQGSTHYTDARQNGMEGEEDVPEERGEGVPPGGLE